MNQYKRWRKAAGLTQDHLAWMLDNEADQQTISRWENNVTRPAPAIYQKLAEALKITVKDLIEAEAKGKAGGENLYYLTDKEADLIDAIREHGSTQTLDNLILQMEKIQKHAESGQNPPQTPPKRRIYLQS